jgi:hypothetical protein
VLSVCLYVSTFKRQSGAFASWLSEAIAKQSDSVKVVLPYTDIMSLHLLIAAAVKINAYDLRNKSKTDLTKQLDELKTELSQVCLHAYAAVHRLFEHVGLHAERVRLLLKSGIACARALGVTLSCDTLF